MRGLKTFILLLISPILFSQNNDVWTSFYDKNDLIGFKDHHGKIRVPAKFTGLTSTNIFRNIVAVMEENDSTHEFISYYLLKNGKKVGYDSAYVFDASFDYEYEGFIRFTDPKTEKTGMFNRFGEIAIPAEYNALTQVNNGLLFGLKGAKKTYWDKDKHSGCNHWSWQGGTNYLIDTNNLILAENLKLERLMDEIDFYSLMIEDQISTDTCRENFKGINGKYYTFINNEKLFRKWLYSELLHNLSRENIIAHSYPKIIFWIEDKDQAWTYNKSTSFINKNYELFVERLSEILKGDANYFISVEDFIATPKKITNELKKYQTDSGILNVSKYPLMNLVITHGKGTNSYQDSFDFLKTENGFKLLSVTIRNPEIK